MLAARWRVLLALSTTFAVVGCAEPSAKGTRFAASTRFAMSDPYKRAVAARLAILPAYVDSFELDVHLVVTRHPEWARAASDGIEAAFNQRLSPRGARLFPSASVQNISGYQELRKWSYQMAREIYKHPWAGVG